MAITSPGPVAIIIDDLFLDWGGYVSNIGGLRIPLLIIGTAALSDDAPELESLKRQHGSRIKIVKLPDHPDANDVVGLAAIRGVVASPTEKHYATVSNIRHVVQHLSGTLAHQYVGSRRSVSDRAMQDFLGPILMCTRLGTPLPKQLLEKNQVSHCRMTSDNGFLVVREVPRQVYLSKTLIRLVSC